MNIFLGKVTGNHWAFNLCSFHELKSSAVPHTSCFCWLIGQTCTGGWQSKRRVLWSLFWVFVWHWQFQKGAQGAGREILLPRNDAWETFLWSPWAARKRLSCCILFCFCGEIWSRVMRDKWTMSEVQKKRLIKIQILRLKHFLPTCRTI